MLPIALGRITSAAVVAAALLSTGCETVERIKETVTADPAPAKKAPVVESSSTKKAPVIESSSTKKTPVGSEPPQAPALRSANAQNALNEGIELYDKGEFDAAIRRLNTPEISSADKPIQIKALKYKAFSYCVTSRRVLCRQQFEKALKIDPAFDLEPGEKGHPLWGSVFEGAKKRKRRG